MRRRPVLLPLVLLAALPACAPKSDPTRIRLSGRIEAPTVDLAPRVSGRVTEVLVREGDRVKSGDVLVRLDLGETALAVERDRHGLESADARVKDMESGSRSAEVKAAEADLSDRRAALDLSRKELARQQSLLAKKVGTERDFDRARTEVERAQAAMKASEERLALLREGFRKAQTEQARSDRARAGTVLKQSETLVKESELRAPADGVILHRIAEPGLLLGPGQNGLTMAFANRLYVRTYVPETRLGAVRPGMRATVSVDAFPGKSFPARVAEISPDAEFTPKPVETKSERVNLVYAAKVDLDGGWNVPLVPGQPAEVTIEAGGTEPGTAK